MATSQLGEEKLNVFWGMPILSSDSISSVAYAVEEILLVLVPAIGAASFLWMPRIALATHCLAYDPGFFLPPRSRCLP